jgi:3-(3-hydroxy-phenyl)propionate hydroxylase
MASQNAAPHATRYADTAHTNGYAFSQGTGYVLPEYEAVVPDAVHTGAVEHHRILILGGGLTGLTLACALAQLGVQAVLLDEDNTVGVKGASSRGICYTQKSLEIFDKLGIYERVKAKGIQWSVGRTFAGQDEVYSFDLKQQNNFSLSQQPAFINIQQFYNEGFLVERIQELNQKWHENNAVRPEPVEGLTSTSTGSVRAAGGVEIRWNNRVTELAQDDGIATFTVATHAGIYRATADYVIDATGSKSPFRQWLNVGVTAKKGDDRWCIADVRFNTRPPTERHTWIEAPFNDNRAVWQHLMADDVWRIDYQMAPDADPEYVSREDVVKERLTRQFGPDTQVDIVWVGPYAYRSECVDRMSVACVPRTATHASTQLQPSQVFFIGDSAKVVSPFGARGGNTGIADADNLAWKLAAVVQGSAAPHLLKSYHAERHEAATTNVQVTNRTARFLRPADGVERLFRSATISLAKQYPFARALINTGRMAVANPYSQSTACSTTGGTNVQNVALHWADGSAACLNDLLRWAQSRPLLLLWGTLNAAHTARVQSITQATGTLAVQVVQQRSTVQAREAVIDTPGLLAQACNVELGTSTLCWAIVRPDSYLAARGNAINTSLLNAIEHCLGTR